MCEREIHFFVTLKTCSFIESFTFIFCIGISDVVRRISNLLFVSEQRSFFECGLLVAIQLRGAHEQSKVTTPPDVLVLSKASSIRCIS